MRSCSRDKLPVFLYSFFLGGRDPRTKFFSVLSRGTCVGSGADFLSPSTISRGAHASGHHPRCFSRARVSPERKTVSRCGRDGLEMTNSLGVRPRSKPRDISRNCLRAPRQFRVRASELCTLYHAPGEIFSRYLLASASTTLLYSATILARQSRHGKLYSVCVCVCVCMRVYVFLSLSYCQIDQLINV